MNKGKSLGLDLGTNSLGWAIVNDFNGDIMDSGVLIFPEGINAADDSNNNTPAAIRRSKRAGRRMKFRRKLRKWFLLKILIANRMTPLKDEELEAWRKSGKYPVDNKAFIKWLHSSDTENPYIDRAEAADGPVDPWKLGRALYHLAQRRGFKSSRKDNTGDGEGANDAEQSKVKGEISELTKAIRDSGCKTLGQYYKLVLDEDLGKMQRRHVRRHYTDRIKHYEEEFRIIMDAQGDAISPDLREELHKAIFLQRPLRSQRFLVGKCPLEPHNSRCAINHPLYEEYRMLCFINNLSFEDGEGNRIQLNEADRREVAACFYKASPYFKFGEITKRKYFKDKFKNSGLKFHYYRDDESISACSITHKLKSAFGEVPFDMQMVFDAISFYDDDDKLFTWVKKHYPSLTDEAAAKIVAIRLREGNASYSLKAITRILRFLRKGSQLHEAMILAKLPEIIKGFDDEEERITLALREMKFMRQNATEKQPPLHEIYFKYFQREYGLTEEDWGKLYINRDTVYKSIRKGRLPKVELGMIRNPLVQRSMTTLRRLMNFLYDHGKIDENTTIRIELARDVNDFATRKSIQNWNRILQSKRSNAADEIRKLGFTPNEDAIDRYILWQEQGTNCIYTGKKIPVTELFSGNLFDIEHTIPRSKSGDDSLANKTICECAYNRQVKQGRVPSECPNYDEILVRLRPWEEKLEQLEKNYRNQCRAAKNCSDPESKSHARVRALTTRLERDYWRDKSSRFKIAADKLTDNEIGMNGFKRRQLVDTGIMCSHAVELLKSVYPKTFPTNGTATAFARKAWGIQGDEAKDRSEHTHHAKDAMVIAALTPKLFSLICTSLKDDGNNFRRASDFCKPPFEDFAEKVRKATNEILVKHVLRQTTLRQSSKKVQPVGKQTKPADKSAWYTAKGDTVRGQLHKDTFYGCIQKTGSTQKAFVIRKSIIGPINDQLKKMLQSIVDPAIRRIIEDGIKNIESKGEKNITENSITMPSGVPINKVRIYANTTNPSELRTHATPSDKQYKNPYYVTSAEGTNFRMALFNIGGKMVVKVDNSLIWAQHHKDTDYVPFDKQEGFVGYVTPGSMALTHEVGNPEEVKTLPRSELVKRLYKVVKFEGNGRITMRRHTEARASTILKADLIKAGKHGAGESRINLNDPNELQLISPNVYASQVLFEGIDFKMLLDGTIVFMNRR